MKSKIVENKMKELPFPKLMKSTVADLVILATGSTGEDIEGTVVYADGPRTPTIGFRGTMWNTGNFEDFYGTVQLSN